MPVGVQCYPDVSVSHLPLKKLHVDLRVRDHQSRVGMSQVVKADPAKSRLVKSLAVFTEPEVAVVDDLPVLGTEHQGVRATARPCLVSSQDSCECRRHDH